MLIIPIDFETLITGHMKGTFGFQVKFSTEIILSFSIQQSAEQPNNFGYLLDRTKNVGINSK